MFSELADIQEAIGHLSDPCCSALTSVTDAMFHPWPLVSESTCSCFFLACITFMFMGTFCINNFLRSSFPFFRCCVGELL